MRHLRYHSRQGDPLATRWREGGNMFKDSKAFSGFSVNDLTAAKAFYSQTLGLPVEENPAGLILKIAGGNGTLIYPKDHHTPATYTALNFPVNDVEQAVDELTSKGV